MPTLIDETGYSNELRTLEDVTVRTIQSILYEMYQRDRADPEYCYVSKEDRLKLEEEITQGFRVSMPPLLGSITRIVNQTTGALITLVIQETFSVGTLMFLYRAKEQAGG